jgi:hypothetical protein
MLDLYGKTINPYLPDGQNWAKQLFAGWTGKRAMDALLRQPINDAVSRRVCEPLVQERVC